jgi:hypothetical protein
VNHHGTTIELHHGVGRNDTRQLDGMKRFGTAAIWLIQAAPTPPDIAWRKALLRLPS